MSTKTEEKKKVSTAQVEALFSATYAPMFDEPFLRLLAFRLRGKIKREFLKNDVHGTYVFDLLCMIMDNQINLAKENGKVSYYFDREIVELVSEATKEIDWSKELDRAGEEI